MWFKINDRWCINMCEVRSFGASKSYPTHIVIKFKDGKEETYLIGERQMEVFDEMCKFVEEMNLKPLSTIIPDEGELPYGLV